GLTAADKTLIKSIWGKVEKETEAIGVEALVRLFKCFPQSKVYFDHFTDLSPSSQKLHAHAKVVLGALTKAVNHLDNITDTLHDISLVHAKKLLVDPVNFELLGHCLEVALAAHFATDFTPEVHLAIDKFLYEVEKALFETYR
uniref:Hemoglobin subunit alpha n=2 Tax=Latimeria chalumnae TaxID=7897 RepID=HBA_LATCH|nr:RecName: Full=Hemoglobin subunit alpha; AltName: Full=Alpha-globin; AltName: Full=Hemoglobin alpha chain [Latimeria chalumnae]AAB20419.1 hemoglobin alpha chain [Latimeria chalumnae, Peptide, 142 aa] [Latimeria chalumnae]prf//1711441A globin alpha [Latimeria chalumnae]